ncbi:MAG TPA: M20/M25/M40 family metallo-hydrolase [Myxococcota bacterium]|nr:M20/M25/M40 family metallo-hydrolase [Myxococcota bacterium]
MANPARAFTLALVLALLGCAGPQASGPAASSQETAAAARLRADVEALTAPAMQGRLTGTDGERLATEFVANEFAAMGLDWAGTDGGFFQPFEFTAGVSLGPDNLLRSTGPGTAARSYAVDTDWRPLAFSRTGTATAGIVFAGYGIVAPQNGDAPAYDSFAGLDVTGRLVLVLRHAPQDVAPEVRQHWSRYASLRHKVMLARDRGALGVLIVSGPRSGVRDELVPLQNDFAAGGQTSVFALSLTDATAQSWLAPAGHALEALQAALDRGEARAGFEIPGLRLEAHVDLVQQRRSGRNVLARLRTRGGENEPPVLVGAHIDHLGTGVEGSSLASENERGQVHPGADDNASGVAAVVEIARQLVAAQRERPDAFVRDVLFAAWSGEEIGLIGSTAFVSGLQSPDPHALGAPRPLAAALNLDMVGRLHDRLILQGVGSSTVWPSLIEQVNASRALPLTLQEESYLPTDATSFYLKGIPVLSAFTGVHGEYHTPRDTADRLNFEGLASVADLFAGITAALAERAEPPDFVAPAHAAPMPPRAGLRVYLGTIPSYGEAEGQGMQLSGVAPGGPAERAGLRAGDRIVELAGHAVENVYDYTYALDALTVGKAVPITVLRDGERLRFEVTPASRD